MTHRQRRTSTVWMLTALVVANVLFFHNRVAASHQVVVTAPRSLAVQVNDHPPSWVDDIYFYSLPAPERAATKQQAIHFTGIGNLYKNLDVKPTRRGLQLESADYSGPRFALPNNIVMYAHGTHLYFNAATPGTKSDFIPSHVTSVWSEHMCFIGEKDGIHVNFVTSPYCRKYTEKH